MCLNYLFSLLIIVQLPDLFKILITLLILVLQNTIQLHLSQYYELMYRLLLIYHLKVSMAFHFIGQFQSIYNQDLFPLMESCQTLCSIHPVLYFLNTKLVFLIMMHASELLLSIYLYTMNLCCLLAKRVLHSWSLNHISILLHRIIESLSRA